jgi:hypothetical protein
VYFIKYIFILYFCKQSVDKKSEISGQLRSGIGEQRSEGRGQRSESRGQRSEDRGHKLRRSEGRKVGRWEDKKIIQKPRTRNQRSEDRG